jgi:type II secretory pathway component PulJ
MALTQEQRDEYLRTLEDRAQQNNNGIYHKYYNNKNGSLIDETSTDNEQQLKYFLQFLQEEDGMGVSVFETDAQLSQFNEVKLNESNPNGTPQRNDCE